MIQLKKNFEMYVFSSLILLILIVTLIQKVSGSREDVCLSSNRTIILTHHTGAVSMDAEQFIPLVLMAQMSYNSPKELLKAQAVVIRTYIFYKMGEKKRIDANELGLPYKTPSRLKAFWFQEQKLLHVGDIRSIIANLTGMGQEKLYDDRMSELYAIIRETEGKTLKIGGKLILPLFHEVSNGNTRSGQEVLGDTYQYLKSVSCDYDMEFPDYEQYRKLRVREIFRLLKNKGIIVFQEGEEISGDNMSVDAFLKIFDATHKDQSGYITYFTLGDVNIDGNDFVQALGLHHRH